MLAYYCSAAVSAEELSDKRKVLQDGNRLGIRLAYCEGPAGFCHRRTDGSSRFLGEEQAMIEDSAFKEKRAAESMFRRDRHWTRRTQTREASAVRHTFGMVLAAMLAIGMAPNTNAVVVFDDFSDGTDGSAGTATNPTPSPPNVTGPVWSRLDGYALSTGQTWDASTGAYRMTALNDGFLEYGVVGAYVPTSFTDVKVSADFIVFGGPPLNPAFGILAREWLQWICRSRRVRLLL